MTFSESETQEALAHGRRREIVTGLRAKDGTEYPLAIHPRRWLVGSGPSCDVVIDDPYVSATHCVLERRAGGTIHVRDRKSRNGTLIDGNLVEVGELQVGARLAVGRTTLVALAAPDAPGPGALSMMRGRDPVYRATVSPMISTLQSVCAAFTACSTVPRNAASRPRSMLNAPGPGVSGAASATSVVRPTASRAPTCSSAISTTLPSISVPLRDLLSRTCMVPPARRSSTQCVDDTNGSSITTSQLGPDPTSQRRG